MLGDEAGLGELQQAADLLATVGTPAEVVSLHERVGWYLTVGGERERRPAPPPAGPGARRVEPRRRGTGRGPGRGGHLPGLRRRRVGRPATPAGPPSRAAEADARAAGDTFTEARALLVAGVCHLWEGSPVPAIEQLRAALELSWANVYGTLADRCGRWLVLALVDAGRFDDALDAGRAAARPVRRPRRPERRLRRPGRPRPAVPPGRRRRPGRALAAEAVATATAQAVAADAAAEAHLLLAHLALDAAGRRPSSPTPSPSRPPRPTATSTPSRRSPPTTSGSRGAGAPGAALVRGRLALLRGDPDGAIAPPARPAPRSARTAARRELMAADRLEGEARAARGDAAAVDLLRSALATSTELESPFLVATTATITARSLRDLAPAVADDAAARPPPPVSDCGRWDAGTVRSA